jgi:RimJ/RimL family protein N-acetyltransferase
LLDRIFISLPTLETERLILRKLLYSDKDDIFSYAKNPEVAKHVLWDAHQNEFDTLGFLNIIYEAYNKNKAAPWGIQHKNEDKIIGTTGFVHWDPNKREAEIGYALSQDYWNRGIISEAVTEVIRFGLEQMDLVKITSSCKPENIGSFKVLEKCGFNFDGIIENQMLIKGVLEDMRMYSLTNDSFVH